MERKIRIGDLPDSEQSPGSRFEMERKIRIGDHVILCFNEDKFIFAEVQPSGLVNISKKRYPLSTLIGAPYRSVWEVSRTSKVLLPLKEKPQIQTLADVDPLEDAEIKADNRDLLDDNRSQKLTQQEILEMQEKGASGQTIIKALVQNSASYQGKTEFSKVKYLKKKAKKYQHIQVVEVLEPSLVNIAMAYFTRKASAICNLRSDSLARLLTFSDARAGSSVLVVETCKGLVTGAIAERIGGYGKVTCLHLRDQPNISAISLFNFPEEVLKSISHGPLSCLGQLYRHASAVSRAKPDEDDIDECYSVKQQYAPFFATLKQLKEVFSQGFDSLVIVVNAVPAPILFGVLPFLKPSSPFVVFSPYLEQLVECFTALQKVNEAINLHLSETWMRQYQVLPSRTRPPMSMNGASGFLLTGTKVYNHSQDLADSSSMDMTEG